MSTKIWSWNVNGIRACIKKGFLDTIEKADPTILCLQEVRAEEHQVSWDLEDRYRIFWNPAERKGYSGTLIATKQAPERVEYGIGVPELDTEGRVITLEFHDYYLSTVYTPNAGRDLARLEYRQNWDRLFLKKMQQLAQHKPVVFCGDLNVAHKELDLANPKSNKKNAGFTQEERQGFDRIIAAEFLDGFRCFEADGGHYTWWSNRAGVRERNIGWRIDYFCYSQALGARVKACGIHPEILGSDHCPVYLDLK